MSTRKRKIRNRKRLGHLRTKGIFCKIDVDDCGKHVLRHRGSLEEGFNKLKTYCCDIYQVIPKIEHKPTSMFQQLPLIKRDKGEENTRRK